MLGLALNTSLLDTPLQFFSKDYTSGEAPVSSFMGSGDRSRQEQRVKAADRAISHLLTSRPRLGMKPMPLCGSLLLNVFR